MISRVFDLQRQVFIVVSKTCTFGIAIGVDIETDCDCDPDTDPDSAFPAALSGSHNQASGSAGGPITPGDIHGSETFEKKSC
jgi:hypothetical protein